MTRRIWGSIVLIALAVGLVVLASAYRERRLEARAGTMYAPTATIKDLMDSIVDPSADVVWNAVSTTVRAGKDAAKVFELGDTLDAACESCHRQYWYPNEKIPDFPSDLRSVHRGVAQESASPRPQSGAETAR